MTTLDLTSASVALVSDLSSPLLIGQNAESTVVTAPAMVRRYAGGRDRIVSGPGETRSVTVSFPGMSRADWLTLQGMTGELVLFRDQRGLAVYGVVSDVTGAEFQGRDLLANVGFTLTSVTYSEVV